MVQDSISGCPQNAECPEDPGYSVPGTWYQHQIDFLHSGPFHKPPQHTDDRSALSPLTGQRKAHIPSSRRSIQRKDKEKAQKSDLSHFQRSGTPSCRSFRTSPAGRRMGLSAVLC
ncbi:hypothetical protein ASPCAL01076 [Aspergillus calidoustus]|uniref:Uncharacterized protein n=1 Tax=Aspergillus calidoustus TaxID=454130 RepID=A0A0U5FQP5_ASPCI|nr:hypothetical protein ASPCAL01076 [Aspergillus calidoustus]